MAVYRSNYEAGVQGPQGPQGPQGEQGVQGPSGSTLTVEAKAANFVAVVNYHYEVDASGGLVTVTVPEAVLGNKGTTITFAKADASAFVVRLTPTAGTINGDASVDLSFQHSCLTLRSTGPSLWRIV